MKPKTKPTKRSDVQPEYVRVADAEVLSGLSRWTWRRYAYSGKVASIKVGERLLIPVAEIRRIMAKGYRPAIDTDTTVQ
jgi:hypothetical protein